MLGLAVVIETEIKAITKHPFLLISFVESNMSNKKASRAGPEATKQRWMRCGFFMSFFLSSSFFFFSIW